MIIQPSMKDASAKTLVLDKTTEQAANLSDDALFIGMINPNGGVTIQSVKLSPRVIERISFNWM